jgi:hypothetical protein
MDRVFVLGKSNSTSDQPQTNNRMALFELRMLLAALILKYSWTRVPDKPDNWDKEMEPLDGGIIHPRGGKCVLKLESRL